MTVRKHKIDVRLSTMPVQYGEACVMRLLDQSSGLLKLEETGMPAHMISRFRYHMSRPYGMILVTGPTGSGKTTTLYAALNELNQPNKKIITVEDPVEYRLPRISQVQVNSKIGLNFGRVLRTTLRQDPDIIMVGEMRDQETVEIGLRGSITGHLVLSTLHTNDATTSAMRLIDMGAAPYLVASALRAVLAQRLIRRVCENCSGAHEPEPQEIALVKATAGSIPLNASWKQGRGCQRCNYTGYRGRVGVFELLEIDELMVQALRQSDTHAFSQAVKANQQFKTLVESALEYAAQGITTLEEVMTLVAGLPYLDDDEIPGLSGTPLRRLLNNGKLYVSRSVSRQGKQVKGRFLSAASEGAVAESTIAQKALCHCRLWRRQRGADKPSFNWPCFFLLRPVPLPDLVMFIRQMFSLTKSGHFHVACH